MVYRLGIDAGSKTIKLVLLNEAGEMVFSQYVLHRSDIITTMKEVLHNTIWRFGNADVKVCVTGSAGTRLAELLGVQHVQEVISTRHALEALFPEADVAIELGGEDAKIMYLSGGVEQRMNGSCAGGTGGFIDQMTSMLGVRAKEFNLLALGHQTIYPIASRCAVFAQTDVRPLLNEGARRQDIAASILQAVVTQTIAGLAWGRPIEGTVVFLGGPFEVYSELLSRFRQTLGLKLEQTIKPKDAHLFVAKGAALLSTSEPNGVSVTLQSLLDSLESVDLSSYDKTGRLAPLFTSEAELEAFKERHAKNRIPTANLMETQGDIFVGIDAGSTMVKLAAVNSNGELLFSSYVKPNGDILETTRGMIEELYYALPCEYGGDPLVTIRQVKVTGYGEQLLKAAFQADSGVVETIAHLRAAQALAPDVDFVLDIGGLDIKCMRIKDGVIDDIMLNESCSSGCGALIEGFSRSLGFTKWSFSEIALTADNPVDLGTRCTVFMTSRVRHAQKEGLPVADIAAGLSYSVVRNALFKVIGWTDSNHLGEHVVVQGGTFKNDSVLRAFELESGIEVIRPDRTELMGAFGAALLARDEYLSDPEKIRTGQASSLLTPMELASLNRIQRTRRCAGCENTCLLTINEFSPKAESEHVANAPLSGRKLITGNRCERMGAEEQVGLGAGKINLFDYERKLLFPKERPVFAPSSSTSPITVGIPAVLDLYETFPFWRTLFSRLGLQVVRAQVSSYSMYRKGAFAVMSEGSCFAAKLAHGHTSQLMEQGADIIFMPTGGSIASAQIGALSAARDQTIECPVSSNYARLIAQDVVDSGGKVRFLTCDLASGIPLAKQLYTALDKIGLTGRLRLDESRVEEALIEAQREQELIYDLLADKTAKLLDQLKREGQKGIVLAGHPYHVDPGLSHGVDLLLNSLGFSVVSASGLLALARRSGWLTKVSNDLVAASWTQPSALYQLAKLVSTNQNLELVQLYSFGCGVDALAIGQVRKIIESSGKLYTSLKMDEMVDLAAIRIRLRSLAVAINDRKKVELVSGVSNRNTGEDNLDEQDEKIVEEKHSDEAQTTSLASAAPVILMPALAPYHLAAISAIVNEAGYQLEVLPEFTANDVESGLRFCNNDLCYPIIAIAGQVINALPRYAGAESLTVIIPQVCCGCRSIELEQIIRNQLKIAKFNSKIEVIGIPSRNELFTMPAWLATRIYDVLKDGNNEALSQSDPRPRVCVLGNAALLYTPQLNNRILEQIADEGCVPCTPPITELLRTNAPLEQLVGGYVEEGVLDFIFLQSFGCLTGHIHARGAAKRLKKRYPEVNISFIEFDPGASEVNQSSRLKLALTIAKERVKKT